MSKEKAFDAALYLYEYCKTREWCKDCIFNNGERCGIGWDNPKDWDMDDFWERKEK